MLYIVSYSLNKVEVESCTGAGAGRQCCCLREDCYASLVEKAANDSDGVLL